MVVGVRGQTTGFVSGPMVVGRCGRGKRGRVRVLPREIVCELSTVGWFGRGRRGRVQALPRGIESTVVRGWLIVLTVVGWFCRGKRGKVQAPPTVTRLSLVVVPTSVCVGLTGVLSVVSALVREIGVGGASAAAAF